MVSGWELAVAWFVTFAAAGLQGIVGLGFAVVSVPVLSLIDSSLAPVPQLLVTLPLTVSMAWRERRDIDVRGIAWVLVGRFPGAVLGVLLLKSVTARALDVVIALLVLAAVVSIEAGIRLRRNPATEVGVGVFSGVSSLVASIGGPPMALLYRDAPGGTIRSSLAAVFTVGLTITIASRMLADEIALDDVRIAALLFPALVLGYLASWRLRGRMEGRRLRLAITIVSTVAAGGLLLRALLG